VITLKAAMLGLMLFWTPSLVLMAILLWRDPIEP
jgi:hypothetical protein